MALIAMLVESDKGTEGKGGCLKTDDEHKEVTARNHQIHTEKRQEGQFIEFTPAHGDKF